MEIFPVTEDGLDIGRKIYDAFPGTRLHPPSALGEGRLRAMVGAAFRRRSDIVFIGAAGIAVRSIAPYLKGKLRDPAVVVVDDRGGFVISLLSGHMGGANELARSIASLIGATPVITTATDSRGLPCVEDIIKRFSFSMEDAGKVKKVNSAILRTGRVVIVDRNPERLDAMKRTFGKGNAFEFRMRPPARPDSVDALVLVSASARARLDVALAERTLVLRPREFVVGLGCDRGVSQREVGEAFALALKEAGISPLSVRNLATIDMKRDERGLAGFAKKEGLEIEFFSRDELRGARLPSGPSSVVMGKIGVGGVCEPAALLSAGTERIWRKKRKVGRVTVAIARAPFTS